MENSKLYIGGLSFKATEADLEATFSQAGTVTSASVITDRETGRSRGFGFVEMATPEEAQAAIDMFHEQEIVGRRVSVNIARPRTERPPRRDGGSGGYNRW